MEGNQNGEQKRLLLKLDVSSEINSRLKSSQKSIPRPRSFSQAQQVERFSKQFESINKIEGAILQTDATALAPERLIVFELTGTINSFLTAIRHVDGLDLIGMEDIDADEEDPNPVMYLLLPTMKALQKISSLWKKWSNGEELERGLTGWKNFFLSLRNVRPLGPQDRVHKTDRENLKFELENAQGNVKVEIELVFQTNVANAEKAIDLVVSIIKQVGERFLMNSV